MESLPRIAITMGDPAGIGPDILLQSLMDQELYQSARPLVVGDAQFLKCLAEQQGRSFCFNPISKIEDAQYKSGIPDVLDLKNVSGTLKRGQPSPEGGKASFDYIRVAVDLAMNQDVEAITTAPINKESLHMAGFHYPGHTELLAELTGTPHVALMLAGQKLRVVLATTHVPVSKVHTLITRDRVSRTIRLTHRWLLEFVTAQPRIAITGLNPHCGDGGIFGDEEKTAILPAMEEVRRGGIRVSGPFSADSFFSRFRPGDFHAVITMYHDQGMIPVKMESRGQAVNITLGLPIIRTSVDHGTAYDLVETGSASPDSLKNAFRTAATLSRSLLTAK